MTAGAAALAAAAAMGSAAAAQDDALARQIENLCAMNSKLAVCTARLEGKVKNEGLDLAAEVRKGEAEATSPVTASEIADCWAVWTAMREYVKANGRGTLPEDYTDAVLGQWISRWDKAVKTAYADPGRRGGMEPAKASALANRRTETTGVHVIRLAHWSGACKKMPDAES